MDKDKRLFPFRKHPVGDILERGKRKKLKKGMGILLAAALLFNTLPSAPLTAAASEDNGTGLCEHHQSHTEECGYAEAADCTHAHTEECYTMVTDCVHTHTEECMDSDAEGLEQCTHECSEDSGCVLKMLDCHHEHDRDCGYAQAHECMFVCEECSKDDAAGDSARDEADVETSDSARDETQEEIPDSTNQEECICEALCTEDSINGDCLVCSVEGADLSVCEGKETDEENTEIIETKDVETEDTSLCSHHKEHTEDCGYIPPSEDGEGSPCAYECRICPIEERIAALPDKVTEDNAKEVRAQLDKILALYGKLTEEEQEQTDLSRCLELQEALDAANAPVTADVAAGDVVINDKSGQIITFTDGVCGSSCLGHTITQNISAAQMTTILVESGTHDITFSGLNLTIAKVGVMPGGAMNLTIDGTNSIGASSNMAGIYVPVGATLVITEQSMGSLNVSGNSAGAGIGGGFYDPNDAAGDLDCGTVIINGGTITAGSSSCSAGIGGASGSYNSPIAGNGGNVTINGGNVTATGGNDGEFYGGAGIGGGIYNAKSGSGGTLTINGGHVTLDVGTHSDQWGIAYGFGRGNGSNSNAGTLILADESYLTLAGSTILDPDGTYRITANPTADMITVPSDISGDKSCVVYAKITDNQGNMTYISSDGMVFDGTAPAVTGVENDKIYCKQQTVTVTDNNLESVTVNGKEVTLTDDKFILNAESGVQIIEARDKAGNTMKVTVNMGHRYGTEWKSNETQHWHECSNCNEKSDIAAHTKDSGTVTKAPTETEMGVRTYHCTVCGCYMGEEDIAQLPPSHTHEFGVDWKKDTENHWHECSGCGERSKSAAHIRDSGTVTKEPTETEAGIRIYCCSVCGYKMDEEVIDPLLPSHTHNYSTEWILDSSRHWHECVCGSRSESAAHTKDSGTVTKPPTETETGIKTYHCSVCGYEMGEEVIEKLSPTHKHSYSAEWKTNSSRHWHECSCGEKSESAVHTKDSGTVTKPPTETETGIKTYHCSVCGYEMGEEVIDKLSPSHTHKFSTDWKTNSSRHWHECNCGEKSESAVHTKDSGTVTKPPTETETGIKTYYCSVCGYEVGEEVIEKLSPTHKHSYSAEWKTNSSRHWHECSCGEKSDSASHSSDGGTVTKKPTKTETGIRTYKCTVCGYAWTEKIAKLPSSSGDNNGSGNNGNGDNGQENNNNENKNNIPETQPTNTPPKDTVTTPLPAEATTPVKPETDTTKPGNGTAQDNTPQSGNDIKGSEPFIKGADGKTGWDVIRAEEEKTEDGEVINVDMNGSTVVPGDIFDCIKGRDVTITFDMGDGIIWSVDGKSVTTDKAGDIDFSVKVGGNTIPVDIVNNVTGERFHIQLSLVHDGDFGFTAVLSINIGRENAGLTASLYYYNENIGELEFISSGEVAENGTVSLAFTHASDYVISVGKEESSGDISSSEATETPESETTGDNDEIPQTGQPWKPWWFVVIGVMVVVIGMICVVFVMKKKKEDA